MSTENKTEITPEKMPMEVIEAKRAELEKKYNCKVHPMVFDIKDGAERVVGYLKVPSRLVKMRMLDKLMSGAFTAGSEALESLVIREETDPRILSEDEENDALYFGAVSTANSLVKIAANQFKKN